MQNCKFVRLTVWALICPGEALYMIIEKTLYVYDIAMLEIETLNTLVLLLILAGFFPISIDTLIK